MGEKTKYSWEHSKMQRKAKRENRYLKYNSSKGRYLGKKRKAKKK